VNSKQVADARGLALTGIDAPAAETYESLINDSYYYRLGVQDRLDSFLLEQPDFGMGHVFKGYSLMSEGLGTSHAKAAMRLHMAQQLPATARERLHQEALSAWISQDWRACGFAWEQILATWPLDLLAFRQHTGTLFWLGDKRRQAQISASVASHWSGEIPGHAHFLSAYSFAMEEIGRYAEAERAARTALERQPQDLWALHALAHVLEMQGRKQEGVSLLEESGKFLNEYNLFRGHLWWHLAIFKFSARAFDEVLDLLDREIYPQSSSFFLDIQNGASLLLRLELQGVSVGTERWERLAQGSLLTATQNTIWFTTVHHVLALLRAGHVFAVEETLEYALAQGQSGSQRAQIAARISEAVVAHSEGQFQHALDSLLALRQDFGLLGASHVQQDLYQQLMISAAMQSGDWPRVKQLLKERRVVRYWNPVSLEQLDVFARQVDRIESTDEVRAELRQ
jgi:tetratricopeptide (TPR) repeat protein